MKFQRKQQVSLLSRDLRIIGQFTIFSFPLAWWQVRLEMVVTPLACVFEWLWYVETPVDLEWPQNTSLWFQAIEILWLSVTKPNLAYPNWYRKGVLPQHNLKYVAVAWELVTGWQGICEQMLERLRFILCSGRILVTSISIICIS